MRLRAALGAAIWLATAPLAAAAAEVAACGAPPAGGGAFTIPVDGGKREFRVHLPLDYDARAPRPLLLGYHGLGGSAEEFADGSAFDELFPEAIRVYPQGLYRVFPRPGFRGDGWQIRAGELGDRDLEFFDALLVWLRQRYCVNPRAVFATGFSNGGFFSNLLGCERPRALAAIAPAAGGMECEAREPLPAIVVHGTADRTIEFAEGAEAARRWAARDGCSGSARDDEHGCRVRSCGAAEVALCAYPVGHAYGPKLSRAIVAFFRRRLAAVDSARPVD